ncbi:MAG: hypothetical protein OEV55_09910 [candidate division Zixibacteria bacterium]|nr:hypothetical protein [candidate division Zixibacteria bacterium]
MPDGGFIFIEKVMADQKMVIFSIARKEKGRGGVLLLEVSKKLLINPLWAGLVVVIAGLFLTTWRRSRET